MADNLTVLSPGAGSASPSGASKETRADEGREEINRLRELAKERTGKNLDDKTLSAIVERKKAKLAQASQLRETRQAFETGRTKEVITNKANEAETKAAKATGISETKSPDGLSERDRTAVRSDPKAGPRLPPADVKPTTPDQAKELLHKILESFLAQDGKSLDIESYAKSLKPRPPSQPKTAEQTQAPATQLTRGSSALTTRKDGLGSPTASLSFRAGAGTTAGANVSASGVFNAGGGLETHPSFDGMHFNWDGFFALFLIRSQKDMQEWRKLMKELRQAEGKEAIAGHRTQIAMLKMRQELARHGATKAFFEAATKLPDDFKKGQVKAFLTGVQPAIQEEGKRNCRSAIKEAREKFTKLAEMMGEGQVYLSEQQLAALQARDPVLADKYRAGLEKYKAAAGPANYAALLADSVSLAPQGQRAALGNEAEAAYEEFKVQLTAFINDPQAAALINQHRMQLREADQNLLKEIRALEQTQPRDEKKIEGKKRERVSVLRQVVMYDQAMSSTELHTKERTAAYEKVHTDLLQNEVPAAEKRLAQKSIERDAAFEESGAQTPQGIRAAAEASRAQHELEELSYAVGYQKALVNGDASPNTVVGLLVGDATSLDKNIAQLSAQARAGDEIAKARASVGHNLTVERLLDGASTALQGLTADPNLIKAVDNAVQGAIAVAKKNRGETDAMMRETVARAQGLISQLVQVLAMSRSH